MIKGFYMGELQPLIRWAVNRGDMDVVKSLKLPEEFRLYIEHLMPEGFPDAKYWVGLITPHNKNKDGWVEGYPHRHVDSVNWPPQTPTLMTYLITPEIGGEIGMGGENRDDPFKFIKPEPGMTVLTDAKTWHGVKPVFRGTRLALLATGWPESRTDIFVPEGELPA